MHCHAVFTTEEGINLEGSLVVGSTGAMAKSVRPFHRDKLFLSILHSLGHRETAVEDAGAITATVIAKLLDGGAKATIEPLGIAQTAHVVLLRFDPVAAVQYKAYHPISGA